MKPVKELLIKLPVLFLLLTDHNAWHIADV